MHKSWSMPIAMITKKFHCSCCGKKLIPYPKTRIIKKGDPDYKKHRTFGIHYRIIGDIELTEYDFKCLTCDKIITYDNQCAISEIQRTLHTYMLSTDEIEKNIQIAKEKVSKRRKARSIISKVFGILILLLVTYFYFKSANHNFTIYF